MKTQAFPAPLLGLCYILCHSVQVLGSYFLQPLHLLRGLQQAPVTLSHPQLRAQI